MKIKWKHTHPDNHFDLIKKVVIRELWNRESRKQVIYSKNLKKQKDAEKRELEQQKKDQENNKK